MPDWQSSQTGPFDLWPNNLGFEHFYGFIGGDTSQVMLPSLAGRLVCVSTYHADRSHPHPQPPRQWRPALFEGNKPIEPYVENPDYNLNKDLADYNIKYIERHTALNPNKPWMVYYAPGAFAWAGWPLPLWLALSFRTLNHRKR